MLDTLQYNLCLSGSPQYTGRLGKDLQLTCIHRSWITYTGSFGPGAKYRLFQRWPELCVRTDGGFFEVIQ